MIRPFPTIKDQQSEITNQQRIKSTISESQMLSGVQAVIGNVLRDARDDAMKLVNAFGQ